MMPIDGEQYVWINPEPAIDEVRLESVGAFCRLIAERNVEKGLPYAFSEPRDWFDLRTGEARLTKTNIGLTCASFVLAVFEAARVPLINEATWILRADDEAFQSWVINSLEENNATAEHVALVRHSLPAVRYRPEEVAGAAACDAIPADFNSSVAMGKKIADLLETAVGRAAIATDSSGNESENSQND
jgi:hypothetical protein